MIEKYILCGFFFCLIACKQKFSAEKEIEKIKVPLVIKRFDQAFFTASKNNLELVKKEYPLLFPKGVADSVWLHQINDPAEQKLYKKVQKTFGDFSKQKKELRSLFQHIKHYHKSFKNPKVITLITGLDYESKVIYADSLLLISLDIYLGKNDTIYNGFPNYIKNQFTPQHLISDVAKEIIKKQYHTTLERQFIYSMVNEGKKMYAKQLYIPAIPDAIKLGYTNEQLDWVQHNETAIWKYFIENNLLYSTDSKLHERFITEAPFSKFYTEIDRESPGRVGIWLGWQIVQSYMKNNDVSLPKLFALDAIELFNNSKYKPQK